jgi:hypothetical protein
MGYLVGYEIRIRKIDKYKISYVLEKKWPN